jgi:hypothetical protein
MVLASSLAVRRLADLVCGYPWLRWDPYIHVVTALYLLYRCASFCSEERVSRPSCLSLQPSSLIFAVIVLIHFIVKKYAVLFDDWSDALHLAEVEKGSRFVDCIGVLSFPSDWSVLVDLTE